MSKPVVLQVTCWLNTVCKPFILHLKKVGTPINQDALISSPMIIFVFVAISKMSDWLFEAEFVFRWFFIWEYFEAHFAYQNALMKNNSVFRTLSPSFWSFISVVLLPRSTFEIHGFNMRVLLRFYNVFWKVTVAAKIHSW